MWIIDKIKELFECSHKNLVPYTQKKQRNNQYLTNVNFICCDCKHRITIETKHFCPKCGYEVIANPSYNCEGCDVPAYDSVARVVVNKDKP